MTTEEIFMRIDGRMTEALMLHQKMYIYFLFLGEKGMAERHLDRYIEESENLAELNRFYIESYDKMIPRNEIGAPAVIPESWYRYKRDDVEPETRQLSLINGVTKWKEWEEETKAMYSTMYGRLMENGDVEAADYVVALARDSAKEMREAIRCHKKVMA